MEIIINTKAKVAVCRCIISQRKEREKKKDGLYNTYHELLSEKWIVRDPDFATHELHHPNQYAYLQHSILSFVLSISTIILRTRLIRVHSQHPIKQVGLTLHSKASLVRNSDNTKQKRQNPYNENLSLKSTDMLQTQSFTES